MLKCPHCRVDLTKLSSIPDRCPHCQGELVPATHESASVQLLDGSGEVVDSSAKTIAVDRVGGAADSEDDSFVMDEQGQSGSAQHDDLASSKTFVSDEWNSQEAPSGGAPDLGGSASVQMLRDSAEQDLPENAATMQSADFADVSGSGTHESEDSSLSKTLVSDEFEDGGDFQTVQSGDNFQTPGEPLAKTMVFDDGADDASYQKTVQSEDFSLQDASPDQIERTLISGEMEGMADGGIDATMLSDDIAPGAVRTMADLWSGAFEARTNPSMTIKGRGPKQNETIKSSLVIRERSMVSPGENKPKGFAAEYELIEILGEGGMGVVYDAKQMSVDRSVAVKMLKGKTASDEKQRQKFLAEAVVTGELDHPNIVPIYDVGTSDRGLLFYSMKKVKGTPWHKKVAQFDISENLEILLKVSDAVAFAHSRGVIHRDLKPENIMLGEFGETLVMDWGLALPDPEKYSKSGSVATVHSMGGTPAYMAPEMASGPIEKITVASDVYLLGAILYEILTGKPPHTGKNTMQCLFNAAKNQIRPLESDEYSKELMDIAMKAMATNPADRYQTVPEFKEAIREYDRHIESITLSNRAAEELEAGEKTGEYPSFNRALFGFEEAIKQWDGNARAKTGLSETKVKFASQALKNFDYDLGLGLLDRDDPEHLAIYAQLQKAKRERDSKQRTLRRLKQAAVAAVVLFIVSGTGAGFWINSERVKAVKAEGVATKQKQEADDAKDDAVKQQKIAESESIRANNEAQSAEMARREAVAQEEIAQQKKLEAEYEGYIAQIGLASAKIEENSFESAYELLQECKADLRNWEWGRLKYLCNLIEKTARVGAPIDALAVSPDGSSFVTGGWEGKVKIWNTKDASEKLTLPVSATFVFAVAYSPDGRTIATAGNNMRVQLWDSQTGAPIETDGNFKGHTDGVLSCRFSRDGSKLLTSSYDKTARLWDVATGQELRVFKGHSWWVWSAVFSPDESRVVTVSQDGSAIVWNLQANVNAIPAQFLEHSGPVYTAAFSPDGKFVATGGYDSQILIWRPEDVRAFDLNKLSRGGQRESVPHQVLSGHLGPVRSVEFSAPGGDLILSGSHDNTVKIWDVRTHRAVKTLRSHSSWVRACAFSPDRRTVFSASHDGLAKVCNITDYAEVRVLQGRVLQGWHKDDVLGVSFSRDGASLVTASRDRTAITWDFKTGDKLATFAEGHAFLASNALFYAQGKRLLTAAVDNTVRAWNADSGTEIARFADTGRSAAIAVDADGKRLLTGGYKRKLADNKVDWVAQVWDLETGQVAKVLEGHKYEVTAVAMTSDRKWMATGDASGHVILWNGDTLEPVHQLKGHAAKIAAALFLPDSSRLLTASADRTVAQWDFKQGKELKPLVLKHPDTVLSIALVPNTRKGTTCCGDGVVRIWNFDDASIIGSIPRPAAGIVERADVSENGKLLLTSNGEEKSVRLWDLSTLQELPPLPGKAAGSAYLDLGAKAQLSLAMFAPGSDSVLTVGGNEARLWSRNQGTPVVSFSPNGIVAAANFSPDSQFVVTGSWDNVVRIWNARTGIAEKRLEGHTSNVNSAVYSPDGKWILTASDDKTARIWNAETGQLVRELVGHTDRVRSAVFSPDGRQVLTASNDSTARLWNVDSGAELGQFVGHSYAVLSAAFSADGKYVVTGGEDKSARIWEVATFQQRLNEPLTGHTASIASVAFLPDGMRVVTGSLDNTAKLWDAQTGKEVLTLKGHSKEVTCVAVSTDGRYVVTSSRDGTAIIWLSSDWTEQQVAQQGVSRRQRVRLRAE